MARWKLKPGAPRHYIRGVGLVRHTDGEFEHPGPPESEWWERVDITPVPAIPVKPTKAKRDAGPAPVDPVPADDSGTF